MGKHTKETLGFNNFSGYYASIPQGYGGFDWIDMDYLNASYWQNVKTNWCDTGFQNADSGAGEALVTNVNGSSSYVIFESPGLTESFTLNSMVAASGWETTQPFQFTSFVFKNGQLVQKASDTVYLSQTAQTIDFSKIGKPGDFKNIVQVLIQSGTGQYGNTCTYGPYGYTTGNQMAFDKLKVTWNGAIPKGEKGSANGSHSHVGAHNGHVVAPHLVFANQSHASVSGAHTEGASHAGTPDGYHTELMSLGGSQPGDLTTQFHLPAADHFGT
jgi:hypothetical protein